MKKVIRVINKPNTGVRKYRKFTMIPNLEEVLKRKGFSGIPEAKAFDEYHRLMRAGELKNPPIQRFNTQYPYLQRDVREKRLKVATDWYEARYGIQSRFKNKIKLRYAGSAYQPRSDVHLSPALRHLPGGTIHIDEFLKSQEAVIRDMGHAFTHSLMDFGYRVKGKPSKFMRNDGQWKAVNNRPFTTLKEYRERPVEVKSRKAEKVYVKRFFTNNKTYRELPEKVKKEVRRRK